MDIRYFEKTKKLYSARNRIIYPGAIYHLIQRAPGKEKLFLEDRDFLKILSLMKETSQKFHWKFLAFVLMPNHLHALIQIGEESLSQGAKYLFESYAKFFNKKYERKGPVFCRPFKSFLCLNDNYFLTISIYIHLNPYKAKLVADPLQYKWSSLNVYFRKVSSFVDPSPVLSVLSEDRKRARQLYKELLEETSGTKIQDMIKSPSFIREFYHKILELKNRLIEKRGKRSIVEEVEKFNKLKFKKDKDSCKARKQYLKRMLAEGYKISEISQILNLSRQRIYKILSEKLTK